MATFRKPNGIFFSGTSVKIKRLAFLLIGGAFFYPATTNLFARSENLPSKVEKRAWSIVSEAITNNDSAIREQVVQGLEFVDDDRSYKAFLSALDDDSEYVRIWAARGLAKHG